MNKEEFDSLTKQGKALLEGLEQLNKSKAEEIKTLQQNTQTPTLESLEQLLSYIQTNIPSDIRSSPIGLELIRSTHRTAAVLDVPYETIKGIFEKYGIQPPVFQE